MLACSVGPQAGGFEGDGSTAADSGSNDAVTDASADGGATTAAADDTSDGGIPKLDVGDRTTDDDTTDGGDACSVGRGGDALGPCRHKAPPDSFTPELQWSFSPADANHQTLTIPLVGNLTDDNADGAIDLCDTPDVVLIAFDIGPEPGNVYVLDGATGELHYEIPEPVLWRTTPALGDIDGDGLSEIVVQSNQSTLFAFEHDGTLKWESESVAGSYYAEQGPCIALADLDNDGDVEIVFDNLVLDHTGHVIVTTPSDVDDQWSSATVAVDLDGDDDMELVHSTGAYHHDGTLYFDSSELGPGFPAIANMDADDDPEVIVASATGLSILEHDGAVKWSGVHPFGGDARRPPAVHDMDGDDVADFAVSTGSTFAVYRPDGSVMWSAEVEDFSGVAGSTAFDFLGDAIAEAMYGDENYLWAFDQGQAVVMQPRTSATVVEYPVVADVDNDGSAEILVGSSHYLVMSGQHSPHPTLQVLRDAEDRWVPARRIWNQHTYHVTNVAEDGTIPQVEPKSWQQLNTFRTQAQIEDGGVCRPAG